MGLFSSSKSTATQHTTTQTTTSVDNSMRVNQNYRDVGLTGMQAVNLADNINRAGTTIARIGEGVLRDANYTNRANASLTNQTTRLIADDAFAFLNNATNNVFKANADLQQRARSIENNALTAGQSILSQAASVAQPDTELMKKALIGAAILAGFFLIRGA